MVNRFAPRHKQRRQRRKKTLTQKVAKLQKAVSSKERKFIDSSEQNNAAGTTPTIKQLSNLAQGLTDNTRIGNKITVTGI